MDKRKPVFFRRMINVWWLISLVCLALLVPNLHTPLSQLNSTQIVLTIIFWLGIIGFYVTFYIIHLLVKGMYSSRGNNKALPALLTFIGACAVLYLQLRPDMSLYETVLIMVASITLGGYGFVMIILFFVRLRFKRRNRQF